MNAFIESAKQKLWAEFGFTIIRTHTEEWKETLKNIRLRCLHLYADYYDTLCMAERDELMLLPPHAVDFSVSIQNNCTLHIEGFNKYERNHQNEIRQSPLRD